MDTVTSKDGTRIAYDKAGTGPAILLVSGALGQRASFGPGPLADLLASQFTVYTYDRRGRGESDDVAWEGVALEGAAQAFWRHQAVAREVEDLAALMEMAGGPACLYGESSGGALVLEAAIRLGDRVRKLAIYEAPYRCDPADQRAWREYVEELGKLIAAGRRGDAVALFMRLVGASGEDVEGMRQSPMWPPLEAVAPTLGYDHIALFGDDAAVPAGRLAQVAVPALILDGGASYPFMHTAAAALANAMPNARHHTLEGQTHEVSPEALAPVLADFFAGGVV